MTIDLRSDTVTRPSAAMRRAMAEAEVGDDVYGEDPTVRALEARTAALLGKEAALFVPSGTMANQLALKVHTSPGDHFIAGKEAHCWTREGGAAAAISGLQCSTVGLEGLYGPDELDAAYQGRTDLHEAPTRLVWVENTHHGRPWPLDRTAAVCDWARAHDCASHVDGARLWNAAVALGEPVAKLAAPFDSVSVCLSKGLGAPVGSLFAGTGALVERARRWRKRLGGGMRQAGILAAAGLYALEHNRARLADDHVAARLLGERLARMPGFSVPNLPETNILLVDVPAEPGAAALVDRAAAEGVLLLAVSPRRLRAVTHLDVDRAGVERAAEVLARLC